MASAQDRLRRTRAIEQENSRMTWTFRTGRRAKSRPNPVPTPKQTIKLASYRIRVDIAGHDPSGSMRPEVLRMEPDKLLPAQRLDDRQVPFDRHTIGVLYRVKCLEQRAVGPGVGAIALRA